MKSLFSKPIVKIICVVVVLLFVPFDIDKTTYLGIDTTVYKAPLYTYAHIEAFNIRRSRFYFFPSNLDVNHNYEVYKEQLENVDNAFEDLLEH